MHDVSRFILFRRITRDSFCSVEINVSQTRFHVCAKVHRCKKHVCERKTLFGQLDTCQMFHRDSQIFQNLSSTTRTSVLQRI